MTHQLVIGASLQFLFFHYVALNKIELDVSSSRVLTLKLRNLFINNYVICSLRLFFAALSLSRARRSSSIIQYASPSPSGLWPLTSGLLNPLFVFRGERLRFPSLDTRLCAKSNKMMRHARSSKLEGLSMSVVDGRHSYANLCRLQE